MAKFSLNKSIEAHKLHANTLTPLPGPDVTIAFGALIERVEFDRDMVRFRFLGELFGCKREALASALDPGALDAALAPAPAPASKPPVPAKAAEPAKVVAETGELRWQAVNSSGGPALLRAKVPGGWLVSSGSGIAFYPDPGHAWDGASLA
jgi:hypothetical protein